MQHADLTGTKFGKLTVLRFAGVDKRRQALWEVRCDCGRVVVALAHKMRLGAKKSCGCSAANTPLALEGQKFGRLTVISKVAERAASRAVQWLTRCDCGKEVVASGPRLKFGHVTSCGCASRDFAAVLNRIHGKSKDPVYRRTYSAWQALRARCNKVNGVGYANYGGRGIKCCERWNSFEAFLEDMGVCPPGLTIERVDNDGNYEPTNCIWADMVTQNKNKRPRKDRLHLAKET